MFTVEVVQLGIGCPNYFVNQLKLKFFGYLGLEYSVTQS